MGQIFHACAFDTQTKTCCVMDADKFHANCYSYCGTVFSIHYLLRQKPYHVMWGGHHVVLDDNVTKFTREEDVLGLSTYLNYEDFEMNIEDLKEKDYYDVIKKIGEHHKQWKRMDVWDEAKKYFEWEKTRSVKYEGYLVNHSKKLAVNLSDYFNRSKYLSGDDWEVAIDVLPILTETGEGAPMALFDGMSAETTEELAGAWCADLLQIVDELPESYQIIPCCFVDLWKRVKYCYPQFGVNDEGYLFHDADGNLFEGVATNIFGKRGETIYNVKVELKPEENKIRYLAVEIGEK